MYQPQRFKSSNLDDALRVVAEHPMALLVGPDIFGSHLPLVADCVDGQIVLTGHFARANPQWSQTNELLVVFTGPSAYVSPRHYDSEREVPTWNYVALHCYGKLDVVEGLAEKDALQKRLIAAFEPDYASQWKGLPQDFQESLLGAIVPFRLHVQRWELKVKLSQNKGAHERQRIRESLAASERAEDQETAVWMARVEGG